jgi:hypothetical protein
MIITKFLSPLYALLIYFASFYVVLIFFLAVMSLKRARDDGKLTRTTTIICSPILYIGLFVDFLLNTIPMMILMLEIPKEWLVSSRLKRHYHGPDSWRRNIAVWFETHILGPFDPSGSHLK